MYYVYFLQSEKNGQYYIGSTGNVHERVIDHNVGKCPATKRYRPWKLLRTEPYRTLSQARKRESFIKRKKSRKIIELILKDSVGPDVPQ